MTKQRLEYYIDGLIGWNSLTRKEKDWLLVRPEYSELVPADAWLSFMGQ